MAMFVRTFSEHNEHFQQSTRLWSFTNKEEPGTLPVPKAILPFIGASPEFPEELEEQGVKTVEDAVIRICTEEEFEEDSNEEEAEWTSWSDILTTYHEWLTEIQD